MGREPAIEPDVTSVCPFCAVGCSLAYDADAERARGRAGAANPDGRLCPKGITAFDGLDRDDRLARPLVREGDELVPASWAAAYDRIVDAFGAIVAARGPDALAFLGSPRCTNEENYLFQKIARLLGTNNVDNRARACHASTESAMAARLGCGAMTNTLADLAEADAFLVIGANPADRQPVAFDARVRPAVNAGATLIHVDPRRTATTRLADYHLAPRPGHDVTVAAAMAAVVVEEGLVDAAFVAERTTGFEAYAARLAEIDVEAAADRAGVAAAELRAAARAFGAAERAATITGTGIEADDHEGTATADAVLNLALLTGNLGKRGAGVNPLRGLNNEQGANDVGCRPAALPGYVPVTDAAGRARVAAEWGVEPPPAPGRAERDLVRAFGGDVRGAWVFGENPAVTKLDAEVVARNLDALDCLVVQDSVPTETAARADVVLPASGWAEKRGTVTNLDRQVQLVRPAADPPSGVRRDFDILCDLGARLTGRRFAYDGPRAAFEELAQVAPIYAGMTYDGIAAGGLRWPLAAGDGVLHRERFRTGDRRAPFVPVGGDGGVSDDGDGLVLVTGRAVSAFVGSTGADVGDADAPIEVHPDDADRLGLADGAPAVVESDRGELRAAVHVSDAIRPGTAYLDATAAEPVDGAGRTQVRVRRVGADGEDRR